jgi:hypothetical protein
MMTRKGAHGDTPLSFAISAISQASIPPRLWALAIRADKRAPGASLADLSTLGGVLVGTGESVRVGGSPARGLVAPLMRPARVVARLELPPATRHFGLQKIWALPPRVDAGNLLAHLAHTVALATMVDLFNKESRPRFPWSGPQLHDGGD